MNSTQIPNQGTRVPNQGMPNQGMPNQGMPNQGMPNQGMPNQGTRVPNQGMPNQGMPNQGMPNQGTRVPNQGMPNQGTRVPNQGMPNQGSNTTTKKPLDVNKAKTKIDGIFKFIQNIAEIIYHFLFQLVFTIWKLLQGVVIHFARLVSAISGTFEAVFLTAFWVFFALAVCVATLWGWWFMGGALADRVSIWDIKWDPYWTALASLIVGFALNSQQVQTQLWQMKSSVASIWEKCKDGKADVQTASKDRQSFLVAKAKKDTQISQFIEAFIQMIYGVVLGIPLWGWLPYLLATLVLPEKVITHAARQVEMLDRRILG